MFQQIQQHAIEDQMQSSAFPHTNANGQQQHKHDFEQADHRAARQVKNDGEQEIVAQKRTGIGQRDGKIHRRKGRKQLDRGKHQEKEEQRQGRVPQPGLQHFQDPLDLQQVEHTKQP